MEKLLKLKLKSSEFEAINISDKDLSFNLVILAFPIMYNVMQ